MHVRHFAQIVSAHKHSHDHVIIVENSGHTIMDYHHPATHGFSTPHYRLLKQGASGGSEGENSKVWKKVKVGSVTIQSIQWVELYPPKRHVRVLTPIPQIMWREGLEGCNQIKMRSLVWVPIQ